MLNLSAKLFWTVQVFPLCFHRSECPFQMDLLMTQMVVHKTARSQWIHSALLLRTTEDGATKWSITKPWWWTSCPAFYSPSYSWCSTWSTGHCIFCDILKIIEASSLYRTAFTATRSLILLWNIISFAIADFCRTLQDQQWFLLDKSFIN